MPALSCRCMHGLTYLDCYVSLVYSYLVTVFACLASLILVYLTICMAIAPSVHMYTTVYISLLCLPLSIMPTWYIWVCSGIPHLFSWPHYFFTPKVFMFMGYHLLTDLVVKLVVRLLMKMMPSHNKEN